jgi:hypothetical protein
MSSLAILAAFATFTSIVMALPPAIHHTGIVHQTTFNIQPSPIRWTLKDLRYNSWGNDRYQPDDEVKEKISLNITRGHILVKCTGNWNLTNTVPRILDCNINDRNVSVVVGLVHVTVPEGRERDIQPLQLSLTEYMHGAIVYVCASSIHLEH